MSHEFWRNTALQLSLFPYTSLFRSRRVRIATIFQPHGLLLGAKLHAYGDSIHAQPFGKCPRSFGDRKSVVYSRDPACVQKDVDEYASQQFSNLMGCCWVPNSMHMVTPSTHNRLGNVPGVLEKHCPSVVAEIQPVCKKM